MKAYFEYEDGSFWAIRTDDNVLFTTCGSIYDFRPLFIEVKKILNDVSADIEKMTFIDSSTTELEADKITAEKRKAALKQDAEFWKIAIEINANLLYFVPDEFKTVDLYNLAVVRNGKALRFISLELNTPNLC